MKSKLPGTNTSSVEVTNISAFGFWIMLGEREVFLPFDQFPWFRTATLAQITSVEWMSADHLYWSELDVDLSVESIDHPDRFPLVSR